jgi:hypothetical protein
MKIDKDILSKIAEKCKDYPATTILGGIGGTFGLLLMLAMGGLGYMMDTKNDMIENMIDNKEEN